MEYRSGVLGVGCVSGYGSGVCLKSYPAHGKHEPYLSHRPASDRVPFVARTPEYARVQRLIEIAYRQTVLSYNGNLFPQFDVIILKFFRL